MYSEVLPDATSAAHGTPQHGSPAEHRAVMGCQLPAPDASRLPRARMGRGCSPDLMKAVSSGGEHATSTYITLLLEPAGVGFQNPFRAVEAKGHLPVPWISWDSPSA